LLVSTYQCHRSDNERIRDDSSKSAGRIRVRAILGRPNNSAGLALRPYTSLSLTDPPRPARPLQTRPSLVAVEKRRLAECDPEVIGVSDVADDELRRRAALNPLGLFRRHALTAAQIWRTGLDVSGFRYPQAEDDLRLVLQERGHGVEDVLECALKFIDEWQLTTMIDDLADLALDPTAPINARVAAGYSLAKSGTDESRIRLRALLVRAPDDPDGELKGLALRSNWPAHLTTAELFNALTPPPSRFFSGLYSRFPRDDRSRRFFRPWSDSRGARLTAPIFPTGGRTLGPTSSRRDRFSATSRVRGLNIDIAKRGASGCPA
jgi:hypothetical protein